MNKLRVVLMPQHSAHRTLHGCSYIRLLLPLTHAVNAGEFDVRIEWGTDCRDADIVVVERVWGSSLAEAEELVQRIRARGASFLFTSDDNLLDLRPDLSTEEQRRLLCLLAREADGVIVSTEPLKCRMSHLNDNIYVIPNALDERLFGLALHRERQRARYGNRLVIGYMGTPTHDADVMMILESLRGVLRKHRDRIELQFVLGVNGHVLHAFDGLPVRTLPIADGCIDYVRFVPWFIQNALFDLAIAPLEDNIFNRSKSDLKFLDYSALGIPGVYSRVASYENTVRHLDTGYLADNTPEAWSDALEYLIRDGAAREQMGRRAQEYVFCTRTLKQWAIQWQSVYQSIWTGRWGDYRRLQAA